jgi:hypothetical protein
MHGVAQAPLEKKRVLCCPNDICEKAKAFVVLRKKQ